MLAVPSSFGRSSYGENTMTLDDQTRTLLARMGGQEKALFELTVSEARNRLKTMFREFDIPSTSVSREEERTVPVEGGLVTIRIYWPHTSRAPTPLPALLW